MINILMFMQRFKVTEVFFELSNENRLKILNILEERGMALRDFQNNLNIPKPEIYRHLKRLIESNIVIRDEKNRYQLSPVGKIIMLYLKGLNLLEKYDFVFRNHDISFLPREFQLSLGDMEGVEVIEGTIEGFNLTVERLKNARSYENIMTREILLPFIEPVSALLERNAKVRIIAPYSTRKDFFKLIEKIRTRDLKIKLVEKVDLVILVDEKSGEFNLPYLNGDIDYGITFYIREENGIKWINRLFEYYWETLPGEFIF
jgi:predicted transcriptional regulator